MGGGHNALNFLIFQIRTQQESLLMKPLHYDVWGGVTILSIFYISYTYTTGGHINETSNQCGGSGSILDPIR